MRLPTELLFATPNLHDPEKQKQSLDRGRCKVRVTNCLLIVGELSTVIIRTAILLKIQTVLNKQNITCGQPQHHFNGVICDLTD